MHADIKWLDQPEIFRVNRLDAHSDHRFYEDEKYLRENRETLKQSLNGIWKFRYSVNAKERPAAFYEEEYDVSGFDRIKVCLLYTSFEERIKRSGTAQGTDPYPEKRVPPESCCAGRLHVGRKEQY